MENLPSYICIVFALTALLTIYFFYKASNSSNVSLFILIAWVILQTIVSKTGFYTITNTLPPRFLLLVLPPLITIVLLFTIAQGKIFIDRLDVKLLTLLHVVRIPVELVLYWLFVYKQIPQLMTFEGRNFDILAGLSAPFIYYFGYVKQKINQQVIIIWNLVCLGLLVNIVVNAVLSAPTPFQQFAFNQPNVAILYFPFVLLPCCIVPLVLLSHLIAMRKIIKTL